MKPAAPPPCDPQITGLLVEIGGGLVSEFALAVVVVIVAIVLMGPICDSFGGAMFNPVHNAAFICAGRGGGIGINITRMVRRGAKSCSAWVAREVLEGCEWQAEMLPEPPTAQGGVVLTPTEVEACLQQHTVAANLRHMPARVQPSLLLLMLLLPL